MAVRSTSTLTEPSLDLQEYTNTPVIPITPNTFPNLGGPYHQPPAHAYEEKPSNSNLLSENAQPTHTYDDQNRPEHVLPGHTYNSTAENGPAHEAIGLPGHAYDHPSGPSISLPGHAYNSSNGDHFALSGHAYQEPSRGTKASSRVQAGASPASTLIQPSLAYSPPFRREYRGAPSLSAILVSRPKFCCNLYGFTPSYGSNFYIVCLRGRIQTDLKSSQKGDLGSFFRWACKSSPTYLQKEVTYTIVELIDYSRPPGEEHDVPGRPNPEYYAVLRKKEVFARVPYQYGFGRISALKLVGSVLIACQTHPSRMWEANFMA